MSNHNIRSFASLGLCSCLGLSLLNKKIRREATKHNYLHPEKGHFFDWKYGKIFYQVSGSGKKKLILAHDTTPYSSGTEWNRLITLLKDKYTIYTLDLLGCGRSDKPAVTYTNYLYVQMLSDFIKEVVKAPAEIWASGFSASYAVTAAAADPASVRSLTLVEPCSLNQFSSVPDNKSFFTRMLLSTPVIGECIYHMINRYKSISARFEEKLFFNPSHLKKRTVDTAYEAVNAGTGSGRFLMASREGRILHFNINHALASLKQPLRIVMGSRTENAKSLIKQYLKYNKKAEILYVSDAGSMPHLENPRVFVSVLLSK